MNGQYATTPAAPTTGIMGPPSRPAERERDNGDFQDVLHGTGIDIRQEEDYAQSSYHNSQQHNNASFAHNGSFNSNNSSFTEPRIPGPEASFYGAGTFNQPAQPHQSPEEVLKEQQRKAMRKYNETAQYHLHKPFAMSGVVESKLRKRSEELGVDWPKQALFRRQPETNPPPVQLTMPNGSTVVATRPQKLLYHSENSPLVDVVALLSLACEDKMRNIVEEAASLSKARRTAAQGQVPKEWADVALTNGNGANSAVSPKTNLLKRKLPFNHLHRLSDSIRLSVCFPCSSKLQQHRTKPSRTSRAGKCAGGGQSSQAGSSCR